MPRRGGQSDQLAANQQEPIELDYGGEELDYNLASSRPQAAGVAGPRYNGSLPKHTITDGRQYSVEPLPRSETSQNGRQLDPRGPPRPYEPVRAATSDRPRLPDPRAAAVHRTMLRYPQGNMPGAQDSEREEGELSDETTHQSLGAGGTPSSHLPNGFAGEGYDHERSASTVPRREPYRERNHIRSQAFDYPRAQPYHPATSPLIRSPAQNRSLPPQHWRGPPYTYPSTSQSASRRSPSPRSAHAAALYAPSLPDQRAPGPRPSYEPQAKGKALELNSRAHAAPRTLRRTEEYRRNRAVASESTSVPTAAAPLNDPRASQLPERGAAPHVDPSASSVAGSVRGGTNGIDRGNTSIGTRPKPGSSSCK